MVDVTTAIDSEMKRVLVIVGEFTGTDPAWLTHVVSEQTRFGRPCACSFDYGDVQRECDRWRAAQRVHEIERQLETLHADLERGRATLARLSHSEADDEDQRGEEHA